MGQSAEIQVRGGGASTDGLLTPASGMAPALLCGSAAVVIAAELPRESVAMVYADPPFGNEKIWAGKAGTFDDRWTWGQDAADGMDALGRHSAVGANLIEAIASTDSALAYLGTIAGVLLAVREALAKTGTLWLHFDDTMGAHLRVLGDVIFGPENQLGLVIWKRTTAHSGSVRRFGRIHDTIACWGRTRASRARLWRIGDSQLVRGGFDRPIVVDGFLEDRLNSTSSERVGYPTQKPVSLVSRFIAAASLPGEVILDPTCGSGTTLVAAKELGRRGVGIDCSAEAIAAARQRLFPPSPAQADLFAEMAA